MIEVKMFDSKILISALLLAAPVLVIGAVLGVLFGATVPSTSTAMGVLGYTSDVCVTVDRADGSHEIVECLDNPNFFSRAGQDAVMDLVTGGTNSLDAFDVIELCQGSNSVGGVGCYSDSDLGPASGFFEKVDVGNWSITAAFTATDDGNLVSSTNLLNSTSGGTYFAGNNFTAVTLNTNDQMTIRWNISIA